MLYNLVIWVSNTLYLSHKSLKTVLFKILNLCKVVKYEDKKTVVTSTATARPGMLLKRLQHMCIAAFMQKEIRKEGIGNPHIVYTLLSAFSTLYQIFKKGAREGGPWQNLNFMKGVAGKDRGNFFQRVCNYFT